MENQSTFYSNPTPSILNMYNPDQEASKGLRHGDGQGGSCCQKIMVAPLSFVYASHFGRASVCGVP